MNAARVRRLAAMALLMAIGMVWGVWMHGQARPDDQSLYGLVGGGGMGAAIGFIVFRDIQGVRRAFQGGAWVRVVVWGGIGCVWGGAIGLLAKHSTEQPFGPFGWPLWGTSLDVWIRCSILGALIGLLEVGHHEPSGRKSSLSGSAHAV